MSGKRNSPNVDEEPIYKRWYFWVIIILVLAVIGGGGYGATQVGKDGNDSDNSNNGSNTVSTTTNKAKPEPEKKPEPKLGDSFEFDDLEITLGSEITWKVLDNMFSEHNGNDVFSVPITVKNLKDSEHNLNMYYVKCFNPEGVEADNVGSYFMDEDVRWAGELKPGASYTKEINVLYEGDGEYSIDFKAVFGDTTSVKFSVNK